MTCSARTGSGHGKGFDTFCPLGPWIETDLDPGALAITTRRDGEVVQDGTTADMVHGVATLISHASKAFTLLPGDVILTGTPAGVGPVEAGQRVDGGRGHRRPGEPVRPTLTPQAGVPRLQRHRCEVPHAALPASRHTAPVAALIESAPP